MEKRTLTGEKLDVVQMYAANKYGHIEVHKEWLAAITQFIETYINGGMVSVFNDRNQFLADFDDFCEALSYIEENEPKNELWYIEIIND